MAARKATTRRTEARALGDLAGIGPAMLRDFAQLGVTSVGQLAQRDPRALYDELCALTNSRQDPCVLDTFVCAVAQARDPDLPSAQRQWWYWSRVRLAEAKEAAPKPTRAKPTRAKSRR